MTSILNAPVFNPSGPSIGLGIVDSFKTSLSILRAVRAVALSMGDDDLTDYAIQLQAAVIEWSKILPKGPEEAVKESPQLGYM